MIEIKSKEFCTGCSACANICPNYAIIMDSDNEGFLYPKLDNEKCIKCGLCNKVCPVVHNCKLQNIPIAYAAYNKDKKIRMESSSGGIFTLIAEHIINNGGVVFGAAFDENFNVTHTQIDDKEKLYSIRGSKYVQSKIEDTYFKSKYYLEEGRKVLFTGTPCQIAGLKVYLGKDYENLLSQDIICQGVPSPLAWRKYLDCRIKKQGKGNKIKKISFRSKDESWKNYKMKIDFEAGYSYQRNKSEDKYFKAFMKFATIRPSCFECQFKGENRQSDITLADFWGIENIAPDMYDDKGTSLVLLNTNKGKLLMNELNNKMSYIEVNFSESIKSNPMYSKSIIDNNLRNNFLIELHTKDFDDASKIYLRESMLTVLINKAKKIYKK